VRGRPPKVKIVRKKPGITQFSPRGRIGRPGYMELKFEELEAIRLADHLDLKQAECANFMGISQQTFSRILRKARKRVSEGLVKGNIIKVKGGDYRVER
jgi:uncharacterized protein